MNKEPNARLINKISYQFNLHGDIVPIVTFSTPFVNAEGEELTKIGLRTIPDEILSDIAVGDTVILEEKDDKEPVFIFKPKIGGKRSVIDITECPICGTPLIPTNLGMGRCLNRLCKGQISQTMILFVASLGLSFTNTSKKIFEHLLVRGAFNSPSDLFKITPDDLVFNGITYLDIQEFLQYVHSIRSDVTISQLIRALRIPTITNAEIDILQAFFHTNNLPLDAIVEMLDKDVKSIQHQDEVVSLDGLKVFISIPENNTLLRELCYILK